MPPILVPTLMFACADPLAPSALNEPETDAVSDAAPLLIWMLSEPLIDTLPLGRQHGEHQLDEQQHAPPMLALWEPMPTVTDAVVSTPLALTVAVPEATGVLKVRVIPAGLRPFCPQ